MAVMSTNPYLDAKFNSLALHSRSPRGLCRSNSFDYLQNRRRITGVKMDQIYNPQLPSLRRIEMDHVLGKLPFEHCRNTTTLYKTHFDNPRVKIFEDRQFNKQVFRGHSAHSQNRSDGVEPVEGVQGRPFTGKVNLVQSRSRAEVAREEMQKMALNQDRFSNYLSVNLKSVNDNVNTAFTPTRYAQTFREGPSIDWKGQLPVPAKSIDLHRPLPTNMHMNITTSAWR